MSIRPFAVTAGTVFLGLFLAAGGTSAQTGMDTMKKSDTMKMDSMKTGSMKTDSMKMGMSKADCMHKAGMEKDSMKKTEMMKSCDAMK